MGLILVSVGLLGRGEYRSGDLFLFGCGATASVLIGKSL